MEPFSKNGYILSCAQTREGVFVDPGDEAPVLLEWVAEEGIQIMSIVNTHAHVDHISGVSLVKDQWNVPIYLHPADRDLYEGLGLQALLFGIHCPPAPPFDRSLEDGQILRIGKLRPIVYHTPGHSPGSISLVVGQHVFCGDVIFAGSIGRTDLPGSSYEILMDTIHSKILPLGDDKILHPGHGPDTSIGAERQHNPFLQGQSNLPGSTAGKDKRLPSTVC